MSLDVTTSSLIAAAITAWGATGGLTPISGSCSVTVVGEAQFRVLLADSSGVFARADFICPRDVNGQYMAVTAKPISMQAIPRLIVG